MTIPKRQGLRSMTELKIHDPSNYVSDPSMESHWQTVKFVSNLPVIKATISIDSQKHDVQCMIDSGTASPGSKPYSFPIFLPILAHKECQAL